MISFEIDPLSTLEEILRKRLPENDALTMQFEVAPLDTVVENKLTPQMILSSTKLFVAYDERIEEYELHQMDMEILGEQPKFSIWQILLEGNFVYSDVKPLDINKLKQGEHFVRLTINEQSQIPKDYMLRKGEIVGKGYQNWAFARLVINNKNNVTSDPILNDMLKGLFVLFNQKTILTFALSTTVYFLIRWLLVPSLPTIFGGILDVFFGILLLLMGVWVVLSVNKNLDRYKAIYFAYSQIAQPNQ